jgi:hypothetical protein
LHEDLHAGLQADLHEDLHADLQADLHEDLHADLQADLHEHLQADLQVDLHFDLQAFSACMEHFPLPSSWADAANDSLIPENKRTTTAATNPTTRNGTLTLDIKTSLKRIHIVEVGIVRPISYKIAICQVLESDFAR